MRLLALPLLLAVFSAPAFAQQQVAITGLTLTLPEDWTGAVERNESRAPQRASYTFNNMNAESSLNGARLIVESTYRRSDSSARHGWLVPPVFSLMTTSLSEVASQLCGAVDTVPGSNSLRT